MADKLYPERFGGCVVLQELTGRQLMKASRYAAGYADVDRTSADNYDLVYSAMRILLAMIQPAPPGDTEEQRAAHLDTILGLPGADHMLLRQAFDRLIDGKLTAEQREILKQPRAPGDLLAALRGGNSPEMVAAMTPEEEQEDLYRVALRVPQVLFGEVPAGIIRRLAETLRREQAEMRSPGPG